MRLPLVLALALLAACSGPDDRIAAPALTPEGQVSSRFDTIELRDISLPAYARGDEIWIEGADGLIRQSGGLRWADDPVREATLDLVRGLGTLTGARVASEPWPFNDYPQARVEVRVERFLASETRDPPAFHLSGQYFVADLEGGTHDRSRRFALTVPLPDGITPAAIAAARARAMADLAREIATGGL